jgi:hypothetical protein
LVKGESIMKKLLKCTAVVGGVCGTVAYLNKYGLPVLGNLTMHLPFKSPIDFWDVFTKGIQLAEGKINL